MSRSEWSGLLKALDKLSAHAKDVEGDDHGAVGGLKRRTGLACHRNFARIGARSSSWEGARMSGTQNGRSPRSVALVGPYSSGKSTLFEALMEAAGTPVKRPADPRNRPATTEVRLGHCSLSRRCVDGAGLPGLGRIRL